MLHLSISACTKLKQEGRLHNVTLSQRDTAPTKNTSKWTIDSRSQMCERGISPGKQHEELSNDTQGFSDE